MFQHFIQKFLLTMIHWYQLTFSPDHGILKVFFPYGYCKFFPSCSEYAYQSIHRHGVFKGVLKALFRFLRCNPFSSGRVDQV